MILAYQTDMDLVLNCASGQKDTDNTRGVPQVPRLTSANARTTLSSDRNASEKHTLRIGETLKMSCDLEMTSRRARSAATDLKGCNTTQ